MLRIMKRCCYLPRPSAIQAVRRRRLENRQIPRTARLLLDGFPTGPYKKSRASSPHGTWWQIGRTMILRCLLLLNREDGWSSLWRIERSQHCFSTSGRPGMIDWAGCCYESPPGKRCLEHELGSLAELSCWKLGVGLREERIHARYRSSHGSWVRQIVTGESTSGRKPLLNILFKTSHFPHAIICIFQLLPVSKFVYDDYLTCVCSCSKSPKVTSSIFSPQVQDSIAQERVRYIAR